MLVATGCTRVATRLGLVDGRAVVREALAAGFGHEPARAGGFELTVLHRGLGRSAKPLHVYIEGDGHAWRTRHRPSRDPTPRDPVALRLAMADPAPAVAYIGRPCQYLADVSGCPRRYWTSHRYAPEVVAALAEVVRDLAARHGARGQPVLVGYSGGGALAVLLAARGAPASAVVTVAANLDLAAWTSLHGVSPLSGSLDPAQERAAGAIPQRHLVGERDRVVPPSVVRAFAAATGLPVAAVRVVPGFDHHCCWAREWPRLWRRMVAGLVGAGDVEPVGDLHQHHGRLY